MNLSHEEILEALSGGRGHTLTVTEFFMLGEKEPIVRQIRRYGGWARWNGIEWDWIPNGKLGWGQ